MRDLQDLVDAGRACRGSSVDFISDDAAEVRKALATCAGCPVRWACLAIALSDDLLVGVWGGTTEDQRRAMRCAMLRGRQADTDSSLSAPQATTLTPRDRRADRLVPA